MDRWFFRVFSDVFFSAPSSARRGFFPPGSCRNPRGQKGGGVSRKLAKGFEGWGPRWNEVFFLPVSRIEYYQFVFILFSYLLEKNRHSFLVHNYSYPIEFTF